MFTTVEAGRAAGRDRASECILAGMASEVEHFEPLSKTLQTARIAARFAVSASLARTIAELAFEKGRLR